MMYDSLALIQLFLFQRVELVDLNALNTCRRGRAWNKETKTSDSFQQRVIQGKKGDGKIAIRGYITALAC